MKRIMLCSIQRRISNCLLGKVQWTPLQIGCLCWNVQLHLAEMWVCDIIGTWEPREVYAVDDKCSSFSKYNESLSQSDHNTACLSSVHRDRCVKKNILCMNRTPAKFSCSMTGDWHTVPLSGFFLHHLQSHGYQVEISHIWFWMAYDTSF